MKRVDLLIGKSRSRRNLVSIRTLEGNVPEIQDMLTNAGFKEGDRVSIVLTETITKKKEK